MSRPRRSVLVLPGSSRRMAEKAATLPADEVVLDLEDALPDDPIAKREARQILVSSLLDLNFGQRSLAVRINRVGTAEVLDDVQALFPDAARRLDSLVVPKVSSPSEVAFLDHLLTSLEARSGISERLELEVQIEDPRGLERVEEIAGASPRLSSLIFGPGDFAAAMGMPQLVIGGEVEGYPGDIWHYPLFRIAVAAKAHGLRAIDGPCSDISDLLLLERSSRRASELGYDGKWVIHPSQLEVVNQAFTPGRDQVAHAKEILAALDGRGGASRLGEEMVDEAHRRMALEVLARAGEARSD